MSDLTNDNLQKYGAQLLLTGAGAGARMGAHMGTRTGAGVDTVTPVQVYREVPMQDYGHVGAVPSTPTNSRALKILCVLFVAPLMFGLVSAYGWDNASNRVDRLTDEVERLERENEVLRADLDGFERGVIYGNSPVILQQPSTLAD